MACATLKRSLDWEAINQRPNKRRRCNPFEHAGGRLATVSAARRQDTDAESSSMWSPRSRPTNNSQPSAFLEASKMSPDKMTQNIRDEIKRLRRCKQLQFSTGAMERMQDSESSGSEMGPDSPSSSHRPDTPPSASRNAKQPLFTFKQVQLICERMIKEREDDLREQYDAILTSKLAEQYDAFVKFTYDQIQRRYEEAPSYLS